MKFIKIFQLLIVLCLFGIACSNNKTSSPSAEVKKETNYLKNGKYDKFVLCMNSTDVLETKDEIAEILKQSMEIKKWLKRNRSFKRVYRKRWQIGRG